MDLFESGMDTNDSSAPLAERMRPAVLSELVGQDAVFEEGGLLSRAIENDTLFSIILWGPPGCGKTTVASIIANETSADFIRISAVLSSVNDVKDIIKGAEKRLKLYKKRTILFVDEIHRFNKSQQDAFLYHVEKGIITLVGATTENPSFSVIPALVSRCRVVPLNPLTEDDLKIILENACRDTKKGLALENTGFADRALEYIAKISDGDARVALSTLEASARHFSGKPDISPEDLESAIQRKALKYDKSGEEHFNLISAFHKSLRGSDPDAAVYWLERMLEAGEDPFYIIRRMVRFATEDVGIADPGALTAALNALESFRFLGHPEGDDALLQAAVYLATAPKSNAVYMSGKAAKKAVRESGHLPVPLHIRNAPTGLMREMGYGKGYRYAHDYKEGYAAQEYLPDELAGSRFYLPTDRGYEGTVKKRIERWLEIKRRGKPENGFQ
ncbi:MAG: replication-associated recombination protein A [Thermodesulfobacteriota bacterium]